MSEQPQLRDADSHSPIRKAIPTRRSSSGPAEGIASARDIAIYFREDCRTLRDSLQLEMVVAQYHLRMRAVLTREGLPVGDVASAGVIAQLEEHGDPLSNAILRALAYVGTGETAKRSAEAVARLTERGIGLPPAFADVAEARALGVWRDTAGGFSDEYALFIDFEYPLGGRHSLAVFVEPRHGGVVKHIGLMGSMSDLDSDDPFHPSALETVEIAAAGALLRKVLDRSFGSFLPDVDDYRVLIAAARARSTEHERDLARG
jgi:hypothetical protein